MWLLVTTYVAMNVVYGKVRCVFRETTLLVASADCEEDPKSSIERIPQ